MGIISHSPLPAKAFERAMVFVDGTNLLYRLKHAKLKLKDLLKLCASGKVLERRELIRIYFYSTSKMVEEAKVLYGEDTFKDVQVVYGHTVELSGGRVREKGVDAILLP